MAFSDSNQLPILVSFTPGTGGKFLIGILNYVVSGMQLPDIGIGGSAHHTDLIRSSAGEGDFILFWGDRISSRYFDSFKDDILSEFSFIPDDEYPFHPHHSKMLGHCNNHTTPVQANIISDRIRNEALARVSHTHITNADLLLQAIDESKIPRLFIQIQLRSMRELAIALTLTEIKNFKDLSFDPEKIFIRRMQQVMTGNTSAYAPLNFAPLQQGWAIPFGKILEKDVPYLLNFIEQFCYHNGIQVTKAQLAAVEEYSTRYFESQPYQGDHFVSI